MTEYWTLKLSMEFIRGIGATLLAELFMLMIGLAFFSENQGDSSSTTGEGENTE